MPVCNIVYLYLGCVSPVHPFHGRPHSVCAHLVGILSGSLLFIRFLCSQWILFTCTRLRGLPGADGSVSALGKVWAEVDLVHLLQFGQQLYMLGASAIKTYSIIRFIIRIVSACVRARASQFPHAQVYLAVVPLWKMSASMHHSTMIFVVTALRFARWLSVQYASAGQKSQIAQWKEAKRITCDWAEMCVANAKCAGTFLWCTTNVFVQVNE